MRPDELMTEAKEMGAPLRDRQAGGRDRQAAGANFAAGGIATPPTPR